MVGVVKVTYFLVPNLLALRAFVKKICYILILIVLTILLLYIMSL